MINYNGKFKDQSQNDFSNRGFLYGDSIFETIKIIDTVSYTHLRAHET